MANCPKCKAELLQDFGLVTCSSCGHVSILDIMGEVQESRHEEPPVSHEPHVNEMIPEAPVIHAEPPPLDSAPEAAAHDPNFENPFLNFDLNSNPEFSQIETNPQAETQESSQEQSMNLSEYANSEFSQAKEGAFVYTVSISDIDSKEIREFLREAINDSRFGWDVQDIMAQVKLGELVLKNISPVKASILINRIKRLPVKIRWEQYAITQADQNL